MDEDLLHDERPTDDYQPIGTPAKTVGLFVGIVVVAAICFGIGYRLGRQAEPPANTAGSPAAATSNIPKPSAAVSAAAPTANSDSPSADSGTQASSEPVASAPSSPAKAAPELAHASPGGNFAVQVAAVSKEEDADALVSALRKKDYPVFVVNPSADKLFHVQVGPFASLADAESMRTRLASDGYNPIVKK
jgi:cell division septation protein DedD